MLPNMNMERLMAAAEANAQRSVALEHVDLREVPWSPIAEYGYQHCQETSMLAHHIGRIVGLDDKALKSIKAAALLHDLGRTQPWQATDPGHGARSADLAVEFLRKQEATRLNKEFIDDVGWLIAHHDLSGEKPSDLRLQCLWDADSYEAARLAPGTPEGLKVFRARTSNDRLCTDWAKDTNNKKVWLAHRGWR